MVPDVFLDQYRISKAADGTPIEMSRNGPAITYKAADQKTGVPVTLTVVPTVSVDPAERERFEQKARTAMLLDHVNIARTIAFGSTDDSLVFVTEFPQGESVEAWVKVHGPMPPDAVLRIALQVVSALGAASFHGLNHPAIQPGNVVIVAGKTAEGGWPLVKLTHFALSGLKSAPGHSEPDVGASDYASPEQLLQGKVDFRSEIYSLGATMCFLLTSVFYSAYPRSPQTKRFRGPLRKLIARMLEDDPQSRPNDPILFTEELRNCLVAVERRQRLESQYGLPLTAIVKKPKRVRRFRRPRPVPLLAPVGRTPAGMATPLAAAEPREPVTARSRRFRPGWAIAASLLALGLIAALFLPEDVVTTAFRRHKSPDAIGVPIGVPETAPSAVATSQSSAAFPSSASSPSSASPPLPPSSAAPSARATSNETVAQAANSPNNSVASPAPVTVATDSSALPPPTSSEASSPAPGGVAGQNTRPEVAVNRPVAPEQSPATIAHVESSPPPSTSAPAVAHEVAPSPEPVTPSSPPTGAIVAKNNAAAREPVPPAEEPTESVDTTSNEESRAVRSSQEPVPETASASDDASESRLTEKPSATPPSRAQKARTKKPVVAQNRTSSRQRVPRALPAESGDLPPTERGSFRARVVGITPNGNVILSLPNGERAIVSPQDADQYSRSGGTHRRPRRVIIERRIMVPQSQAPPYQPFMPPDT